MYQQSIFFKKFKFVFTRTFVVLSIFSLVNYAAIQVYAVYYPTDNITNPACAPGASGCYVSLLPDQTSNSGSLLFSNGTNPAWSNPSALTWDSTNGRLKVNDMIQVGNTAPGVYSGVKPGLAVYDQNNVSVEGYLSVFHSAVNGSTGVVHRYLNQRGTDPASPSPYLAGDYAYREQISSYGTGGGFLAGHSIREIQYITDSTTGNVPTTLQSIRSGPANVHTSINLLPSGTTIGNINSVTYTSTALARLAVIGSGTTSSTYTAQFQNSTGTNNALVIRDDGSVGVGTDAPSFQFHMVGSAPNMTVQRYSDSSTPPVFRGWKSRGTVASPTAVQAEDGLASFVGGGYDSTGSFDTASIKIIAAQNFSDSSHRGTYISFFTNANNVLGASGGFERMRISDSGNIGIGTATPSANLHIEPSGGTGEVWQWIKNSRDTASVASLYVENNSGMNIALKSYGSTYASTIFGISAANTMSIIAGGANNGLFIGHSGNSKPIIFGQGSVENMRIAASSGNIGIGSASPITRLSNTSTNILDFAGVRNVDDLGLVWKVASTGAKYVAGFENTTNSTGAGGVVIRTANTNGGTYLLQLVANGTETASFTGDGNAFKPGGGSFTATSDNRAKKDIIDLTLGLNAINSLKPVTFKYNGLYPTAPDNGKTYVGLIAQDVVGTPLEQYLISTDESTGLYRLDPSAIPFALVGAVKELDIKLSGIASLDVSNTNSVGSLVKSFVESAANNIGVVFFGEVHTKKLCIDDVCITKDQLIQILQNNQIQQAPNNPAPEAPAPVVEQQPEVVVPPVEEAPQIPPEN